MSLNPRTPLIASYYEVCQSSHERMPFHVFEAGWKAHTEHTAEKPISVTVNIESNIGEVLAQVTALNTALRNLALA